MDAAKPLPFPIIVLAGNISSGKTTILRHVASANAAFRAFEEPVEEWAYWLSRMYSDPSKFMFLFQLLVLAHYTRITSQIQAIVDGPPGQWPRAIVVERSPLEATEVFCQVNKAHLHKEELAALRLAGMRLHQEPVWSIHAYFVYVYASATTCHKRLVVRKRIGEGQVGVQYLRQIEDAYSGLVLAHRLHETVQNVDAVDPELIRDQTILPFIERHHETYRSSLQLLTLSPRPRRQRARKQRTQPAENPDDDNNDDEA